MFYMDGENIIFEINNEHNYLKHIVTHVTYIITYIGIQISL